MNNTQIYTDNTDAHRHFLRWIVEKLSEKPCVVDKKRKRYHGVARERKKPQRKNALGLSGFSPRSGTGLEDWFRLYYSSGFSPRFGELVSITKCSIAS